MSRISTSQIFERTQRHVGQARERETQSAEKASTGRELVRPSQNPSGYLLSSNLKDDLATTRTMIKNAELGTRVLNMTENMFAQVQETMQRAYELGIASSGKSVSSDAARQYTIGEIRTLRDAAIQLLNTRYGNRTLLSGFRSDGPAFDKEGNYLGDAGEISVEVGRDMKIPINITGARSVMGAGVKDGVNILLPLQMLVRGVETDNSELIHGSLELFNKANDQISLTRGEIGARLSLIDRTIKSGKEIEVSSIASISEVEDADAIKVFSDLARDRTALEAAISTGKKLITENPTDKFYQ